MTRQIKRFFRLTGEEKAACMTAIFSRIIRSFIFNAFMFALGFVLGVGFMAHGNHLAWMKRGDLACLQKIEECFNQHKILNEEMQTEFQHLKLSAIEHGDRSYGE